MLQKYFKQTDLCFPVENVAYAARIIRQDVNRKKNVCTLTPISALRAMWLKRIVLFSFFFFFVDKYPRFSLGRYANVFNLSFAWNRSIVLPYDDEEYCFTFHLNLV